MAQPVIAAALATARLGGSLPHALRGTLNGFWLGVLADDELRALDERYYAGEDVYRTDEWNERGLGDWEREAVAAVAAPGASVLVVGCGGGREVLGLLEAGYDARGCESHPELRAFAERFLAARGHPGRVAAAARDAVPDGPRCDVVLAGWGTYSLVHPRAARVAFLAGARRRLEAGGAVVLSCFGHRAAGRELAWTARLAGALRRARRRTPVEVGDTLAPNRVRVLTGEEVAGEAAAAGLELARWQLLGVADGATRYALGALRVP
jgi:SAM-dependent methyltransferase